MSHEIHYIFPFTTVCDQRRVVYDDCGTFGVSHSMQSFVCSTVSLLERNVLVLIFLWCSLFIAIFRILYTMLYSSDHAIPGFM